MALLSTVQVSTRHFSFKDDRFVTEASDLGKGFRLDRIWNDACDHGFTMVSERTGRSVLFVCIFRERNADGEILADHFQASENSGSALPWYATIYND